MSKVKETIRDACVAAEELYKKLLEAELQAERWRTAYAQAKAKRDGLVQGVCLQRGLDMNQVRIEPNGNIVSTAEKSHAEKSHDDE